MAKMQEAVAAFKKQLKSSAAGLVNDAPAEALESVNAEVITKHVPPAVKK